MQSLPAELLCLHCHAKVKEQEIKDGWCESCGKKLPLSYKGTTKKKAAVATPETAEAEQGANSKFVLLAFLAGAAFLVLTATGVTLLAVMG